MKQILLFTILFIGTLSQTGWVTTTYNETVSSGMSIVKFLDKNSKSTTYEIFTTLKCDFTLLKSSEYQYMIRGEPYGFITKSTNVQYAFRSVSSTDLAENVLILVENKNNALVNVRFNLKQFYMNTVSAGSTVGMVFGIIIASFTLAAFIPCLVITIIICSFCCVVKQIGKSSGCKRLYSNNLDNYIKAPTIYSGGYYTTTYSQPQTTYDYYSYNNNSYTPPDLSNNYTYTQPQTTYSQPQTNYDYNNTNHIYEYDVNQQPKNEGGPQYSNQQGGPNNF